MVSALVHLLVLAAVLWRGGSETPQEEQAAPSFAVQFEDSGVPAPSQNQAASPPRVSLGGDELPPLPQSESQAEPAPETAPMFRYGTARHRQASANPFAHVVPFDLRPQSRPSVASNGNGRSLDLSAGPVVRNGVLRDAVAHVAGTHGMSDWGEALRAFVEEHKYYPREAAENGEQGAATLRVTVARDGTVKRLTLVSSSGSPLLDAAWMAVFRDNKLPPFNDDMGQSEITFNYELDYSLIYR